MVAKNAFGFASGTAISRVLGLVREITLAYYFGAGFLMDAFRVAFNIPNLLRDILAEGTLTPSFIPVLSDRFEKNGKESAFKFVNLISGNFLIISSIVAIIGIIIAPILVKIIAFGFTEEKSILTTQLTRIMFPFLIFITLSAIVMGVLNLKERFFTTGFAPGMFNIGIICTILVFTPLLKKSGNPIIISAACGVVIGGALYFFYQLLWLTKEGYKFHPTCNFRDKEMKKVLLLMLPIAFGFAAMKINTVINTLIASFLAEGSISYLNYAYRLVQLPIGVIGVALANVALPLASQELSKNNLDGMKKTIYISLRYCFLLTLPVVFLVIIFANPFCKIIYQHGSFLHQHTVNTASCLRFYSPAILGVSMTKILASGFYSLKDTKTPLKVGLISVAVNLVIAISLVKFIGFRALALAVSISSIVSMLLLYVLLRKKLNQSNG
jgi:putative peptidoglycan lipid II flippase